MSQRRPSTRRRRATVDEVNEASGSTPSGGLQWTHCQHLCGVFHADGCKTCEDWRIHCVPLWLSSVVKEFWTTCDEASELKRLSYARETDALDKEINELTRELEAVNEEIERIQKDRQLEDADQQSRLEVAYTIHRTVEQLQTASGVEATSCPRPPTSSSHLRKCPRLTQSLSEHASHPTTPSQELDVIWIDSDSEDEHAPTTAAAF